MLINGHLSGRVDCPRPRGDDHLRERWIVQKSFRTGTFERTHVSDSFFAGHVAEAYGMKARASAVGALCRLAPRVNRAFAAWRIASTRCPCVWIGRLAERVLARPRRWRSLLLIMRRREFIRGPPGRSILTTSDGSRNCVLSGPDRWYRMKSRFWGYPPEAAYTDRFKSRGLIHEDRDRILRPMRL